MPGSACPTALGKERPVSLLQSRLLQTWWETGLSRIRKETKQKP